MKFNISIRIFRFQSNWKLCFETEKWLRFHSGRMDDILQKFFNIIFQLSVSFISEYSLCLRECVHGGLHLVFSKLKRVEKSKCRIKPTKKFLLCNSVWRSLCIFDCISSSRFGDFRISFRCQLNLMPQKWQNLDSYSIKKLRSFRPKVFYLLHLFQYFDVFHQQQLLHKYTRSFALFFAALRCSAIVED